MLLFYSKLSVNASENHDKNNFFGKTVINKLKKSKKNSRNYPLPVIFDFTKGGVWCRIQPYYGYSDAENAQ